MIKQYWSKLIDEKKELRDYAESWIRSSSLALAIELALVTFTVNYFLENSHNVVFYLAMCYGMVVLTGSALAAFFAARDPRQQHFSTLSLIDIGIKLIFGSAYVISFVLSYGVYVITGEFQLSIIISISMIIGISIIFASYHHYIIKGR